MKKNLTNEEILSIAKKAINDHGLLHYCSGGLCACLGCVNSKLSFEDFKKAKEMPEIMSLLMGLKKKMLSKDNPDLIHIEFEMHKL